MNAESGKDLGMGTTWNTALWGEIGAAIDMLESAMQACPEDVWSDPSKRPEWVRNDVVGFWYLVYHTLFMLDYRLSDPAEPFAPPTPFNLDELDPSGLLPEKPYTKDELQRYLDYCREKCRTTIRAMTPERACERRRFGSNDAILLEWLLDSMRHVQHHTAQLHLILRQKTESAPRWVRRTKRELKGEE